MKANCLSVVPLTPENDVGGANGVRVQVCAHPPDQLPGSPILSPLYATTINVISILIHYIMSTV